MKYISLEELNRLLEKEDLTKNKNHCIGLIVNILYKKLEDYYSIKPIIEYGDRVVTVEDNYYTLGYLKDEITLSERYTKYITENTMLRTQMSSVIPKLLRNYKKDGDKLYICPGIVYRRDVRDKTHVGEPHQLDIWYLTEKQKTRADLLELVSVIIDSIENIIKRKIEWRYSETSHNYTDDGIEVEIKHKGQWLEVLECGLISKEILSSHNISNYGGLALGLGLERLVMIIKSIDDIRILYQHHPKVKKQLENLNEYKQVSNQPSTRRDLSIAINKNINEEELTELILNSLDLNQVNLIESIKIISETSYENLPIIAVERLGIDVNQKNVLLRVILRDLTNSIESQKANDIYTQIYKNIHQGTSGYLIS